MMRKKKKRKKKMKNKISDNTGLNIEKSVDKDRSIISSLNRTVNKIYEYARSNHWEYFVTLTFNSNIDRYDYDECSKSVKSFLDDIRRNNRNVRYVLVP